MSRVTRSVLQSSLTDIPEAASAFRPAGGVAWHAALGRWELVRKLISVPRSGRLSWTASKPTFRLAATGHLRTIAIGRFEATCKASAWVDEPLESCGSGWCGWRPGWLGGGSL